MAPGAKLNVLHELQPAREHAERPGRLDLHARRVHPAARRRQPFNQTPVTYDVSLQSNGCYKAESPPSFVGQQTMKDADGNQVVNPLFVIYGCFNPL